ncbi:MAG: sulfate adenylyltransferase, partial [Planctomycetota bacterium]
MPDHLIAPHGGRLVDLMAAPDRADELRSASRDWTSLSLSPRQVCDLELLMNGALSPLDGFLGREDYDRVLNEMRIANGLLWPVPVVLDVTEETAESLEEGKPLVLRDPEGVMLAVMEVDEVWLPDREEEAERVFGTADRGHPGVARLLDEYGSRYVGGRIEGVRTPLHYDFLPLRLSPAVLRRRFARIGWRKVVAFQTRDPMHRAHVEIARRAAREAGANLLIHPVVGLANPGDIDHYTRVRTYQAAVDRFPPYTARLALLNLFTRLAGPREALWHAIIRKNHACTHIMVGRDHAGATDSATGEGFYDPEAAQEMASDFAAELGVTILPVEEMVYVEDLDAYRPEH